MSGKKKLVIAAVAVAALVIGAVCLWWFFPGDQRPVNMSARELERYWPYAAPLDGEPMQDFDILEYCTPTEYKADIGVQLYTSYDLPKFLYRCDDLREIAVFDGAKDAVSINYVCYDGMEVYSTLYLDGTFGNAAVYDPQNDTYYEIYSATEGYKYTRFRNGPSGRKFYPPER